MAALTLAAFERGLHAEHVQEIGLLYDQRMSLSRKPGHVWVSLLDLEDRIEAHLDALVLGGAAAMRVAVEALAEGEPGELYAATLLVCRHGLAPALAHVLKQVDFAVPAQCGALVAALSEAMPETWSGFVGQSIDNGRAELVPVLAQVSGRRRWPHGPALLARLSRAETPTERLALIEALGRLQHVEAEPALKAALSQPDPTVREAAIGALWRMDRPPQAWPSDLLTRVGWMGPGDADDLRARVDAAHAEPADLLALGAAGVMAHWAQLFRCLAHEPLAAAAAQALHWSTGAELWQEVLVPEPIDEQALFEPELQAWRQSGTRPLRLDGQPFGDRERRLSLDPEVWRAWFSANLSRFQPHARYRFGQPHGPQALVDALRRPQADAMVRRISALELAVRYGAPEELDTRQPVRLQMRVLAQLAGWAASQAERFEPGGWFVQGRRQ